MYTIFKGLFSIECNFYSHLPHHTHNNDSAFIITRPNYQQRCILSRPAYSVMNTRLLEDVWLCRSKTATRATMAPTHTRAWRWKQHHRQASELSLIMMTMGRLRCKLVCAVCVSAVRLTVMALWSRLGILDFIASTMAKGNIVCVYKQRIHQIDPHSIRRRSERMRHSLCNSIEPTTQTLDQDVCRLSHNATHGTETAGVGVVYHFFGIFLLSMPSPATIAISWARECRNDRSSSLNQKRAK